MIVYIIMMLFLAMASYYDLRYDRIPNRLLIVFGLFVVLFNLIVYTLKVPGMLIDTVGAIESLTGLLIPLIVLLPLWLIKAIGAGDIKLLMVMGLSLGTEIILIGFYSFIVSALIGLFYLVKRGVLMNRMCAVFEHIVLVSNKKRVIEYKNGTKSADAVTVAFAPCVLIGLAVDMLIKLMNGGIA